MQHLGNFSHTPLIEKGFVLLERGRVIKAIDVDAVGGSAQPHRLAGIVRTAFENSRNNIAGGGTRNQEHVDLPDPYSVLGATQSDSDEEIKKKYKRAVMEYHPDRVAHLGQELRDLAARKGLSMKLMPSFVGCGAYR